jgi:hypothetical protein
MSHLPTLEAKLDDMDKIFAALPAMTPKQWVAFAILCQAHVYHRLDEWRWGWLLGVDRSHIDFTNDDDVNEAITGAGEVAAWQEATGNPLDLLAIADAAMNLDNIPAHGGI